jgi:hypothetical protein
LLFSFILFRTPVDTKICFRSFFMENTELDDFDGLQ